MTQITKKVQDYLGANVIISTCLMMNITSFRALARHICKELDLNERNLHAIVSAIRRYKAENKGNSIKTIETFTNITTKTKDDVIDVYMKKNTQVLEKLKELKSFINFDQGDTLRILQAERGIRIIIDENKKKQMFSIFHKHDVVDIQSGLAELNIQFYSDVAKAPGIIAKVSASLNAGGVNIVEIMSCAPELVILIDKNDLPKAFNVIANLKQTV